jgi:hypothetical protein
VKARQAVEKVYPHIASVDVDLELDDALQQQHVANTASGTKNMSTGATIR